MSNQGYPYNPTGNQNYAPPPPQQQQQQPYYPPQQQPYNPQQQQQPYYPPQQQPYNPQQPPQYSQAPPPQQQQPYYPPATAAAEKPIEQKSTDPYVIDWMVTGLWVRSMTVQGAKEPSFELKHDGGFIGLGDKVSIFTLSPGKEKEPVLFARLDWHSFKGKVDILFKTRDQTVTQRRLRGDFESGVPALGKLDWVQKRMVPYGAALWELNDASGQKLVTAEVNDAQSSGSIKIWKTDFKKEDFEVLLMCGVAQIEDYKKLIRDGKRSAAGVVIG